MNCRSSSRPRVIKTLSAGGGCCSMPAPQIACRMSFVLSVEGEFRGVVKSDLTGY